MILDGKELSQKIKNLLAEKCSLFEKKFGRKPCLAVILAGDNSASRIYVRNKCKCCQEIGMNHKNIILEDSISQEDLLKTVNQLNADEEIDGILVQLPLPAHIDEKAVFNAINPEKDVDGFTPVNMGKLLLGEGELVACTPKGILGLLDEYGISTQGKDVCVVGRSNIVGKPICALLVQKDRNATVTECHSLTVNLKEKLLQADIIICAVGVAEFIKGDMVKDGAVVIDVGMNRIPDSSKKTGYRLCGDVDYESVCNRTSAITPVPGGVGPMTIAMLMENTLIAACRIKGIEVSQL